MRDACASTVTGRVNTQSGRALHGPFLKASPPSRGGLPEPERLSSQTYEADGCSAGFHNRDLLSVQRGPRRGLRLVRKRPRSIVGVEITMGSHLRPWRRSRLLAVNHLATIALGMSAVTAVVSLMLAVAFQPLPFRDAARLVQVWNRVESGAPVAALSGSELIEMQRGAENVFASLGGFTLHRLWLLDERGAAQPLQMARLDEAAFRALDVTPVLGRPVSGSTSGTAGFGPSGSATASGSPAMVAGPR